MNWKGIALTLVLGFFIVYSLVLAKGIYFGKPNKTTVIHKTVNTPVPIPIWDLPEGDWNIQFRKGSGLSSMTIRGSGKTILEAIDDVDKNLKAMR